MWDSLRLNAKEEIVDIDGEGAKMVMEKGDRSLLGKIWIDGQISKTVIQSTMGKIWKLIFVMNAFDGYTPLSKMKFDVAALWVQFHSLPFASMSKETGIKLRSSMGSVEDIEVDEYDLGWGNLLRTKIAMDLRKPLPRGQMVMLEGIKTWVPIQYENLPWFCLKCGRIIHDQSRCPKALDSNIGVKQYGSWLRAEARNLEEGGGHGRAPVPDDAKQAYGHTAVSSGDAGKVWDTLPKNKEISAGSL
ncbi:unnamed protein product [Fraxinus pennsylvanica]|uniref:Zinc knuckle CX2CX4HX4C domain-containing protein n=1 Tax=Fraxinus pennsylvanica TaxID=56036 RepID=A0AAD1Z499_9LAMI|nr:unnamed protein product [Fraxinus pennsylvanica]